MSDNDLSYIEAFNCLSFAAQIWGSRQVDKYADAQRAYEMGKKIYEERFLQKNICIEDDFEF